MKYRMLLLIVGLLVLPASASAAVIAPATPVPGFGDQPGLAQIAGAALVPGGGAMIAGTADSAGRRRAVAVFVPAAPAAAVARGFGPTAGAFDVAFAADAGGDSAVTFTVGHVAYLATCHSGRCRPTVRVGTSSGAPQSAVAVQPLSGRTLVLWRGRTSGGVDRLQWRITTSGRLGPVHTLGESGRSPQVATDASGKTVAVWLTERGASRSGVRTAARRVGAFLPATTVTSAPAGDVRVVSSDAGATVAAWLTARGGIDPEDPQGTVQVSTRTRSTAFAAPRSLGAGSTISLAGSPDGHAVLATDRHVTGSSVVVAAARRSPGTPFGALTDVSPAGFVSDAFGAQAAVADGGRALVSWAAGVDPSAPAPAGVFAALADGSGASFGAPQLAAGAQTATLPQPTGAAISATSAVLAWVGPQGAQIARLSGP